MHFGVVEDRGEKKGGGEYADDMMMRVRMREFAG